MLLDVYSDHLMTVTHVIAELIVMFGHNRTQTNESCRQPWFDGAALHTIPALGASALLTPFAYFIKA